jgi:excinuclease ABC subunit B
MFRLHSKFKPKGDQPRAIQSLVDGICQGKKSQVLLGVTGSGKTFTMANIVEQVQKPTLVLAHNKTLAAQLYQEFKSFFPENAVEYFVSYYDYYQPEAYIARTDTYIEKDMAINDQIDRMRLSATRSLLERKDVLIVSSVSCIYGLGVPEYYSQMKLSLSLGEKRNRDEVLIHLAQINYKRNDYELKRGTFRVRGDVVEVVPAYEEEVAYRIEFFGDIIERISSIDPLTGKVSGRLENIAIFPGSHHITPEEIRLKAIETIQKELMERAAVFEKEDRFIERQRILERTRHDVEMLREIGSCNGIENYSRYFSGRKPGEPPTCLIDYFGEDYLLFIDESHQSLPQIHAMYNGDRARKDALVTFGFRLPSAYDNRPQKFAEFYQKIVQVIYVSATPGSWEIQEAGGEIVSQIIRPTGLLDPCIELRAAKTQVDDVLEEIRKSVAQKHRVLVTTLTKKLAEDLSKYLIEIGVKAEYLHSDIDTFERVRIINDLRRGVVDVLVGINLLREGLDIPEVALVAILDADKEGFLRSETSLIQTCGRAARNVYGRVIMYADKETKAIKETLKITAQRRKIQQEYNDIHKIVPRTIHRPLIEELSTTFTGVEEASADGTLKKENENLFAYLSQGEIVVKISMYEKEMKRAAKEMRFEEAAQLRNKIKTLNEILIHAID